MIFVPGSMPEYRPWLQEGFRRSGGKRGFDNFEIQGSVHVEVNDDVKAALKKINYTLKPLDIVLIHTGAGAIQETPAYLTDHVGMTGEATHYLLDQGVKMAGIDAVTFDPPVWAMFELKKFWEAHRVMLEREYYHLENMTNFDKLPPHGFTLSVLPIKWVNTTASPVRAIAIIED